MFVKRTFILLLLSVFVVSAQGANLLTNGNFNTGDLTGWEPNLIIIGNPPADVNAYVQTAINYDGSPCLFMRSRTGAWQGAEVYQVVNVDGLETVDFSCVANKWAWGNVRVDLNWYSGPYDPENLETNWLSWEQWDIVVGNGATTDWDSFAHTFTVPATAQYVVFALRVNDWTWQVYFDDVFFGTYVPGQPILLAPAPGSSVPEEDKSNCGFGPTLQWIAATEADGNHLVYFGTSFADVNDANTSDPEFKGSLPLATTSYTLSLADVAKGQAYCWRVDETVGGNVIKSQSIWQFSVSNLTWVDRFDNYPSDIEIQEVWGPNSSNASDFNMIINYNSSQYAVSANTSALLCSNDISQNAMLVLLVKGHDDMSDNLYVRLESNNGAQSGIVHFPDKRELNQQLYESSILWPIDLQDFVSQGVILTNVTKITIGVDNGSGGLPSGSGMVTINDIRLDYPWCDTSLAELIPADLTKNCYVGMEDLDSLANNWLAKFNVVTAAAPTTGPILWYKCDEGYGNDPLDSSGNNYNGFINDLSAWGGAGTGHDGTDCLYLSNAYWVQIPIAVNNAHNTIGSESTVSVWLKDPGQSDRDSTILQIGTDGHTINIWIGATGSFFYKAGWNTTLGWGDSLDIGSMDYTNPEHPQDQWVHYAFVKSLSGGFTRAYRNGKLFAESTAVSSETPAIDGANSFASLGAWRWSGGTGGYYDGWIDDFRIYDYALPPAQVLYLAVEGGTATSPMTQGLLTTSDATGDDVVNFKDLAIMAQYWLQQVVWPQN